MSSARRNVEKEFLDLCRLEDDVAAVREALEAQPELVQCRDTRLFMEVATPLHCASLNDHEEVVRVLLEHGAEVNAQDADGVTPLHFACEEGHEAVVRLLLEHGGDPNAQDRYGRTPLGDTARCGHEKVARLLLANGADRSIRSNKGETARDVAEHLGKSGVVVLLDTYFPIEQQLVQVLLGLPGPSESPLTRFAAHELFEPKVLSLVKCLLTGDPNPAFEQLQQEALEQGQSGGDSSPRGAPSSSASSSSRASKKKSRVS